MTRPNIGTVHGAANLDDESYVDFVEGLRAFNLSRMVPKLVKSADIIGADLAMAETPATIKSVFTAMENVPAAQMTKRMMRSTQLMMWRGTFNTYRRIEGELLDRMDAAEKARPDLISIDPDFEYPDYLRAQDIHLQPGSYQDDPLAGFVFQYGSKVFFTGGNDDDKLHNVMVEWVPIEGTPERIVDLGCGVGQSTTAFKQRFPGAEVHGVDIAAPMLRYAHARARDLGIEVHFSQQDAADLKYEDNSVDAVMAMILFHELPQDVTRKVVSEAARILKPGGTFTVIDFPHIAPDELSGRHTMRLFDSWFNGEPFAPGFVYSDFTALLNEHFSDVNDNYKPAATSTGALQIRVCRK